jgi:hypothetical protein
MVHGTAEDLLGDLTITVMYVYNDTDVELAYQSSAHILHGTSRTVDSPEMVSHDCFDRLFLEP